MKPSTRIINTSILSIFLLMVLMSADTPGSVGGVRFEFIPTLISAMGAAIAFFIIREFTSKDNFIKEMKVNFIKLEEERKVDRDRWDKAMRNINEKLADQMGVIIEIKGIAAGNRASIERHEKRIDQLDSIIKK